MPSPLHIFELNPQLDFLQTLAAFEEEPLLLALDSASGHRQRDSRYSLITADPVAVCRVQEAEYGRNPFEKLREWQRVLPQLPADEQQHLPPFCGGIAGLMSYELGHAFERLPSPSIDDFQTPALLAGLFDWAIVWDHIAGTVRGYVLTLNEPLSSPHSSSRADWIRDRLNRLARPRPPGSISSSDRREPGLHPDQNDHEHPGFSCLHRVEPSSDIFSDFTRDEYIAAVSRVIEYIRAGISFRRICHSD